MTDSAVGSRVTYRVVTRRSIAFALVLLPIASRDSSARPPHDAATPSVAFLGSAALFAPGVASTASSDVRLTISPDGRVAMWFSRDRPGGAGGYDIWMSRRTPTGWGAATPVPFNSPTRDFDPAFSADGRFIYFCSDRSGGIGGDDIYRVTVLGETFGAPEHLGGAVNSAGNEFAPMLSPDGTRLLFSSDRPGGSGRHDLYVARRQGERFDAAAPLPGEINGASDDFDATYLSDSRTIVFARAASMKTDRIDLFFAAADGGHYEAGRRLPASVNDAVNDTYGPMLDWSRKGRLTFSSQRDGASSMELYVIDYVLRR